MAFLVGELVANIGADSTKFNRALADARRTGMVAADKIGKRFEAAGVKMKKVGRDMTFFLTAPLLGVGFAAVSASMKINESMANIATLIPGNTARVKELKSELQAMAVEVGKSTTDLSAGLYQTISAFGDGADTLKILEINAKAAAAGLSTTTEAIDLTSAVTKGYGDTSAAAVRKAADMGLMTVRLGQTDFPQLAASIGRVTPLAAELGVASEELFTTFATGTGVTGKAAEVSTQLRGVLQSMLAPTADMRKLFIELNVENGKAMLKQLGLKGTIDAIVEAADKAGIPLQKYIGSIEGQTIALALTGSQSDTYAAKLAEMQKAAGTTAIAFKEQTEGINAAGFLDEAAVSRDRGTEAESRR